MYSYEDRIRAVKLYIEYDFSAATVIGELGYPSYKTLVAWCEEFQAKGDLKAVLKRRPKYSKEQKETAVSYYLEHGRCIRRTVRMLGYPSRAELVKWIDELAPGERKVRITSGSVVQFSQEDKKDAVLSLCTRDTSAKKVANKYGVSRGSLYKWRKELLGKQGERTMDKEAKHELGDKATLSAELERLKKEVHRLQMEVDILNQAAEVLKKGLGIDLKNMTNREKATVIDALRNKYSLNELLTATDMAKSSYFYQRRALRRADKYAALRTQITDVFKKNRGVYGYRRVHAVLLNQGLKCSEKVIRRIMREEHLVVPGKKKRRYNSYMGEISPAVPNLLERDFHADKPNQKWVTDISEFQIPAGKVYLSPIIDCFDGLVVSWAIGTSPNAELTNTMLDGGIACLNSGKRPIVHTDRGGHYRWPGWISRMDAAGLIRSMSKKGCSPDNAACEGFFGTVKIEMFYTRSWDGVSVDEFIAELDAYIRWSNEERIKLSLGGLSPIRYRQCLGLLQ